MSEIEDRLSVIVAMAKECGKSPACDEDCEGLNLELDGLRKYLATLFTQDDVRELRAMSVNGFTYFGLNSIADRIEALVAIGSPKEEVSNG
jgi:hypothetical protein